MQRERQERGREERGEGERRGRERGREKERERGREGGREGDREGDREGGREGGMEKHHCEPGVVEPNHSVLLRGALPVFHWTGSITGSDPRCDLHLVS